MIMDSRDSKIINKFTPQPHIIFRETYIFSCTYYIRMASFVINCLTFPQLKSRYQWILIRSLEFKLSLGRKFCVTYLWALSYVIQI